MEIKITLTGTLCEVGQLEGEKGEHGIRIARDNGTFITIKGMPMEEVRTLAGLFFEIINVELAKA